MPLGGRTRRRGRWVVVLLAVTLVALAAAGPARAQDSGTTFGTGKATAIVAQYVPSVGTLKLAIATGVSIAELRNQLAQSQAQTLDLGLIGGTLTAIPCQHDQVAGQEVLGDDPS